MKHFLLFLLLLPCVTLVAQRTWKPTDVLKPDPRITMGRFPNGLTYYIRENKKPEKRMELRLAVKAGSVLEDDDQQGLAHFVEHMAFNGTKNFPKQDLVNFLEKNGVRFGPHLNAYTSFDQTVYMIQVPTDSVETIRKAFQILEDWAHNISFDNTEIDKERGVVGEEWRLGRGAFERVQNKHNPTIFFNSQYAKRLPIGKKETIDSAHYDVVKRFYKDWYRPDLMAVAVVGDFKTKEMLSLITKHFAALKNPAKERPRTRFTLPDHNETLVSIATDKELPMTSVGMLFKRPQDPEMTVTDYRRYIVNALYDAMLNDRLQERLQKPNPPFIFGGVGNSSFVGQSQAYNLSAGVKEDAILPGFEAIYTEAVRVQQHGFTATELERQKADMLRSMEQSYNEREKTESGRHVDEYLRNFLDDELIPGIETEFALYKQLLPGITVEEMNAQTAIRMQPKNRIIIVSAPLKDGVTVPAEKDFLNVVEKVGQAQLDPYVDAATAASLIPSLPPKGSVVSIRPIADLGTDEWTLSNGIRVIVKSTDFKNDEVLLSAWSPGGTSLVADKDFVSATWATQVVGASGVGAFDAIALQKMLAGKVVRVAPIIGELSEGFSGSASPKDLETLFQLTYLYSTAPRLDTSAVGAYKLRLQAYLKNMKASPEATFQDTVQVTLTNYHFRGRPMTPDLLNEVDPQRAFAVYRDRYADMGDFVFFIIGNIDAGTLRPFVEQYLASLPATKRGDQWTDVGVRPPTGGVAKVVKKGIEPKSQVQLVFHGLFPWNADERFAFNALIEVMRIKLREVMREDKGGVYGVSVGGAPSKYPRNTYSINVGFGCDPKRVEELISTVYEQMDSLRIAPVAQIYVDKVKELQRRDREVSLKQNGWWVSAFRQYTANGEDPHVILDFPKQVEKIDQAMIQATAKKYFGRENSARLVLLPETQN